ncbi:MAG TPA: DNA recombination protein RmuC [Chitinophagaceae bacterium]|nr:DNA recombination protein RmuC [Chitinophagaceae bacterium]
MNTITILLIIISILIIFIVVIVLLNFKRKDQDGYHSLEKTLSLLNLQVKETESNLQKEFVINRQEIMQTSKDLRVEVGNQINLFTISFSENLSLLTKSIEEKFQSFQQTIDNNHKNTRTELKDNLEGFRNELSQSLKDYKDRLKEQFLDFEKNQKSQHELASEKLLDIKFALERSVKSMQEGNESKLEEMRKTVDEKLQKTLETRLAHSFDLVSKSLESVHKGLGEMQQLAIGVGDLKKVLSNVKTRGILGEIQLSNILEQLLSPEQYDINVITKKGSSNRVEFAIKIPQQYQENKVILMPIDSKFPLEDYYSLVSAYETNDTLKAELAGKALELAIKKAAKDIHEKYIHPPDTTEIGLLFLPIEGLYAEAVRRPALMETLQREYQIILTGPTTLSAILSTISFGYKTMALEQRSGEIKKTLSAVKTEFNKFGDVLKKAQEKINKASEDIDELVGARTKKINARLKSFEELPVIESNSILQLNKDDEDEPEDLV